MLLIVSVNESAATADYLDSESDHRDIILARGRYLDRWAAIAVGGPGRAAPKPGLGTLKFKLNLKFMARFPTQLQVES